MKKKILTSLLMGAFLFASTSMITSCKDYDDDINDLKALVNADKAALEQAKSDLEGKISGLQSQLSGLEGKLTALESQAANHVTKTELQSEIAALEARIATAYVTKQQLNDLIGGNLTGDLAGKTYKEAVEQVYANLKSVSSDLGTAMEDIASLKSAINDPKTGLLAVQADLKQQMDAIQKYLGKYGADDATVAAQLKDLYGKLQKISEASYDDTEIQNKINNLAKKVNDLYADGDTPAKGDISTLKKAVKDISSAINDINASLNVLNVLIQQRLRSLVFIPDAYYWGIEATSFNYLDAFQYTLAATDYATKEVRGYEYGNKKYDDRVSDDALMQAGSRLDHSAANKEGGRYDSIQYTSVMDLWANYHLNPSDVIIDDITDVQVIDADKDYVLTRASEAKITTKKDKDGKSIYKIKDGVMSVQLDVKNPDKIKSVLKGLQGLIYGEQISPNMPAGTTAATQEKPMVTIFATQAYLQGEGAKEDTIITSDYATLYADIYSNIRLSHKYSTTANPVPFTGVQNAHCGYCALYANDNIADNDSLHLMATVHEATVFAPQDTCNWDETLDLRKLVETHWDNISGVHEVVPADKMKEYGLTSSNSLVSIRVATLLLSLLTQLSTPKMVTPSVLRWLSRALVSSRLMVLSKVCRPLVVLLLFAYLSLTSMARFLTTVTSVS